MLLLLAFAIQLVLLPRNKADNNAKNHSTLLEALEKGRTDGSDRSIMGTFLKEKFEG